ncbi:glycosyltransferase family protein [Pontibacter fetidus]|uniref:Glycosyltransferase family 4 protein n=1 Tax=Pontibacter fetidus TaxID=2700082 RepID=A0A6B2H485_9BACT|nr:glycosyltransferase family 4 protein [Pontibacter fetidus]NDK55436.1 glycosyltransferase family 4 protein [Pontibacter fetidus]
MSEKRILLASLLKPVNDTRMYGKLGLSLSKLPNTQVHIAGFSAPLPASVPVNVQLYPIFSFGRLSLQRFTAQQKFWQLLQTIKPDLLIVCTHELLLTAWLYCKRYRCHLIYDVQENYSLNLTAQDSYNPILKRVLATGVRQIEQLTAPTINHFLLAEQSYAQELPFIDKRFTILENKFKPEANYSQPTTPVQVSQGKGIKLLYSGTISGVYGVFEAVRLAEQLHTINPLVTLTIIGYCAHAGTLQKLKQTIADKHYISLIGGEKLVPHAEILKAIATHDIGLLPYQPNPSTFRCIPTKLYEYMAYGLPILIQQNPIWENLLNKATVGLNINFIEPNVTTLLQTLYNTHFYSSGIPDDIYWQTEEEKLMSVVTPLLQDNNV